MATSRQSKTASSRLEVSQRLALIQNTDCSPTTCLSLPDESINFDFFKRYKIPTQNFAAAKVGPLELKMRGVSDAAGLEELGFDALHLANPGFCDKCIASYGAESVLQVFLTKPADSVAIAGMPAVTMLNVTTERMLQECAGAAVEAAAVLKEQQSLESVQATTLLDTGIRAKQLVAMGYTAESVRVATGATPAQIQKMGFS